MRDNRSFKHMRARSERRSEAPPRNHLPGRSTSQLSASLSSSSAQASAINEDGVSLPGIVAQP